MTLIAEPKTTEAIALTPLLKWAGGKRKLAPAIAKFYEPFRTTHQWAEPFVGGMGATLGVMPADAILNDSNPHLINFYEWVKGNGVWDLPRSLNERRFYDHRREWFNDLVDWITSGLASDCIKSSSAQLFYYLNRTCFNGLCRFNGDGKFNVPFGKYKTITYQEDFTQYQEAFDRWRFRCGDFEHLTGEICDRPTFTYCDSPYDCEFTTYSKGGFKWDDQVRLAEWCAKLPGPVLVSNAATERIIKLYTDLDFQIEVFPVGRSISCKGDERKPALEIFAFKSME
ncbi:MAG TPA: Dam family site-specific DNA-(adenine-N6)-methyltransferase [Allocoleopsis sp.]